MKVLLLFLVIVGIKALINLFRIFATKYYYKRFLKLSIPNKYNCSSNSKLNQYSEPVKKLFNCAGTQHVVVTTDRIGRNRMYQDYISNQLADNSAYSKLCEIFENTIGVFKLRFREAFYPTYWLFIPFRIFEKSKFGIPKFIKILINLLYWLLSFTAAYFLEHFLDSNIPQNAFQEFFHNLK